MNGAALAIASAPRFGAALAEAGFGRYEGRVATLSVLLLAVGLSMDAMAVAAARGLAAHRVGVRDVALVGGVFGSMQGIMPLLGWRLAERFGPLVDTWDHWIAFALLSLLGGKMIVEAWRGRRDGDDAERAAPFALSAVLLLGVATSIDAFAAGLTLPLLHFPPLAAAAVIGVVTATLSALGIFAGRRLGAALGPRLEIVGGLALIAVGTRVLVTHLFG